MFVLSRLLPCVLVSVGLTHAAALSIAKQGFFYVGGHEGVDAMFVQYQIPSNKTAPWSVIMIHGQYQNGSNFLGTPDDRPGWAEYFLSHGFAVYIVDQVARARSPWDAAVDGPLASATVDTLERQFTAIERFNLWPQARLHTQWPGSGTVGDPIFDQFMAETLPMIGDARIREAVNRDATIALLDKIGPAILMPHSQSAAPVWLVADARPQLVKALLMVEAGTSSFYEVKLVGAPDWFKDGELAKPFGITYSPITYAPPVKGIEDFALVRQDKPDAPDLARCWQQKEPVHKLTNLKAIPTLQMSAEASFGAPTAHCNAAFLKQAGVPVDFIRLADIGIRGNGHFLMLEQNNLEIAAVIADWLDKQVTPAEATGGAKSR